MSPPPQSALACASSTDVQKVCSRDVKDDCGIEDKSTGPKSMTKPSCRMGAVDYDGTSYPKCTTVTDVIDSKQGEWVIFGLSDGQISSTGNDRNYRIRTDAPATGKWALCISRAGLIACDRVTHCTDPSLSPPPQPPSLPFPPLPPVVPLTCPDLAALTVGRKPIDQLNAEGAFSECVCTGPALCLHDNDGTCSVPIGCAPCCAIGVCPAGVSCKGYEQGSKRNHRALCPLE